MYPAFFGNLECSKRMHIKGYGTSCSETGFSRLPKQLLPEDWPCCSFALFCQVFSTQQRLIRRLSISKPRCGYSYSSVLSQWGLFSRFTTMPRLRALLGS
ncbi:hypothetical protein H105_06483 [Trichophyton soudanense CBS 452.61]|uniref:Uncharacterized protein n=1 Tax=Trichophyton soudanense CBS 452.61 TaxID=1215331 RepID=A0A022XLR8_TRISD|nr:hypothetical protein H105_06483 [Trichophyton soudanense CBS 452.61]EZG03650.1 hypothetical protein H106_06313 [Trichophyton rubrum CBS 735.88]